MTVRLLVGDVRKRIREIPDGSIDLVAGSPPFWNLRDYGGQAKNDAEMGSEDTPAEFLDALLSLTEEFRRVLAPHGSIAIELGDSYFGSGGAGGDYNDNGLREGQSKFRQKRSNVLLPKSLCMLPALYPASLAYGWNMLNPDHRFDRWRVRNVIVWARPNPPVGALGDKVRPATSYITVACTSAKRWFDLDAVRGDAPGDPMARARYADNTDAERVKVGLSSGAGRVSENPAGAPPLDWWEDDDPTGHATLVLPTQPYPGAHYATWPSTLAHRLISMMCPLRVCTVCGEPSRRIVEQTAAYAEFRRTVRAEGHAKGVYATGAAHGDGFTSGVAGRDPNGVALGSPNAIHRSGEKYTTLGWSDCGHDNWRPGVVLDPFCGSGTSLAVAQGLGRDATGVELYPASAELCRQRVGMFLTVDDSPTIVDTRPL